MHISKIPEMLFSYFLEKYAPGATVSALETLSDEYEKFVKLAENFGAIGFRKFNDQVIFAYWGRAPRGTDDVFEPRPSLEISAGPVSAGVWAAGRGQKLTEVLRAKFHNEGLRFRGAETVMVAAILEKTNALVLKNDPIAQTYWEAEKNPNRSYVQP